MFGKARNRALHRIPECMPCSPQASRPLFRIHYCQYSSLSAGRLCRQTMQCTASSLRMEQQGLKALQARLQCMSEVRQASVPTCRSCSGRCSFSTVDRLNTATIRRISISPRTPEKAQNRITNQSLYQSLYQKACTGQSSRLRYQKSL